jgi:hypothetical protein
VHRANRAPHDWRDASAAAGLLERVTAIIRSRSSPRHGRYEAAGPAGSQRGSRAVWPRVHRMLRSPHGRRLGVRARSGRSRDAHLSAASSPESQQPPCPPAMLPRRRAPRRSRSGVR